MHHHVQSIENVLRILCDIVPAQPRLPSVFVVAESEHDLVVARSLLALPRRLAATATASVSTGGPSTLLWCPDRRRTTTATATPCVRVLLCRFDVHSPERHTLFSIGRAEAAAKRDAATKARTALAPEEEVRSDDRNQDKQDQEG